MYARSCDLLLRMGRWGRGLVALLLGVALFSPAAWASLDIPVGTHSVICWFRDRGVPDEAKPGPARWPASGTGVTDLTLTPSIQLLGGCNWHGFITAGVVTTC